MSALALRKEQKVIGMQKHGAPGDGGQRHQHVQLQQVLRRTLEQAPRVQPRVRQVVPDDRGLLGFRVFDLLPRI